MSLTFGTYEVDIPDEEYKDFLQQVMIDLTAVPSYNGVPALAIDDYRISQDIGIRMLTCNGGLPIGVGTKDKHGNRFWIFKKETVNKVEIMIDTISTTILLDLGFNLDIDTKVLTHPNLPTLNLVAN